MSYLEEVKKILWGFAIGKYNTESLNLEEQIEWKAKLICHLSPKSANNPDKGRLLTPEQIIALVDSPPSVSELALALIARREQDAKTASAVRAECGWCDTPLNKEGECQARVERVKKEIEEAGWIDPSKVIMPGEFGTPKAEALLAEWVKDIGYVLPRDTTGSHQESLRKGDATEEG